MTINTFPQCIMVFRFFSEKTVSCERFEQSTCAESASRSGIPSSFTHAASNPIQSLISPPAPPSGLLPTMAKTLLDVSQNVQFPGLDPSLLMHLRSAAGLSTGSSLNPFSPNVFPVSQQNVPQQTIGVYGPNIALPISSSPSESHPQATSQEESHVVPKGLTLNYILHKLISLIFHCPV